MYLWLEALFHLPFSLWAIPALLRGTTLFFSISPSPHLPTYPFLISILLSIQPPY